MGQFATKTSVDVDATAAEIRKVVSRYGATAFATAEEGNMAVVAFKMHGRSIRFTMVLPPQSDFTVTPRNHRARSAASSRNAWNQSCRSLWRALLLIIRAKLEAVETGIVTFEDEFLAQTMIPGTNMTVSDAVKSDLALSHERGEPVRLLPFLGA